MIHKEARLSRTWPSKHFKVLFNIGQNMVGIYNYWHAKVIASLKYDGTEKCSQIGF